jgi:hypothetical protein
VLAAALGVATALAGRHPLPTRDEIAAALEEPWWLDPEPCPKGSTLQGEVGTEIACINHYDRVVGSRTTWTTHGDRVEVSREERLGLQPIGRQYWGVGEFRVAREYWPSHGAPRAQWVFDGEALVSTTFFARNGDAIGVWLRIWEGDGRAEQRFWPSGTFRSIRMYRADGGLAGVIEFARWDGHGTAFTQVFWDENGCESRSDGYRDGGPIPWGDGPAF